ncbi:MAG: glycosyltransferase family 39 protein [Deltaproteobacteria bacterium]|nr:glycosyltransferase family 39 protein [Deltaproteobacteria bacterium]
MTAIASDPIARAGHRARPAIVLAVGVACMTLFARLGGLPLLDPDEGRNASVAQEMLASGAWVVPTFNGLAYMDKPAFFFRAVAQSFAWFGSNETSARLPSALHAAVLLVIVGGFCARVYGRDVAALAILITATAPLYVVFARTVIFDMPLALYVCGAVFAGFLAAEDTPSASRWALVSALAMGIATLVKGPVGLLVPVFVLVVFFLADGRPGAARAVVSPRRLAVTFAVVLPWFVAACIERPDFASYGLVHESLRRFTTDDFRRSQPFWFYGPVMLLALFPWSALAPEAAVLAWQRRARLTRADRLLLVWVIVVVAFFSVSRSKLPGYVLSAVIAAAILTARLIDRAIREPEGRAHRLVIRALAAVGVAASIAAAVAAASWLFGPEGWQRLLGRKNREIVRLVPLFAPIAVTSGVVAAAALWARARRSLGTGLLVPIVLPISALTLSFPALSRYAEASTSRAVAAAVAREAGDARVASVRSLPPGLPYYLSRPIALITDDGHESTSNYQMSLLRDDAPWPDGMIRLAEATSWLARRHEPTYLIAYWRRRDALAELVAPRGLTPHEITPGWWGVLVPAA